MTLPSFERTAPYAFLQGAGMAVTKSDETHEYASVVFLEWITQNEQNMQLSSASGYMPVTVEAIGSDYINNYFEGNKVSSLIRETLDTSIVQNQKYIMYAQESFEGGLDSLLELAINDRESIANGANIDDFLTDTYYEQWCQKISNQ
jgi:multiple sugar transport system substrate-binding protein